MTRLGAITLYTLFAVDVLVLVAVWIRRRIR